MKEKTSTEILIRGLSLITLIAVIWILGKYVMIGVMPFIIAYAVSLAIRSVSLWLSKRTKLGRKMCEVLLVIITISVLSLFVSWLVSTLANECQALTVTIGKSLENEDNIIRRAIDFFSGLRGRLPHISKDESYSALGDSVYDGITTLIKEALTTVSSSIASGAAEIIGKLPSFVFALVTTVISVFYLSLDSGEIGKEISLFAGEKNAARLRNIKTRAVYALSKYVKSYMIIMLMTFSELLLGFVVLNINYGVLLAFIISLVDLLPVLGCGTVLVPWALIALAAGKVKIGAGLLILWVIMYIVRQIAEPHIIGSVMGIHPLISLFAIYIGYVFLGVGGMIFLPITVYLAKVLITEKT